ncbi:MAG: hypothetical protein U9Q76_01520 [candidate division WOR-3 bacterium]|nr:hypothetical protein [candidate division WOR-3 bacterium]
MPNNSHLSSWIWTYPTSYSPLGRDDINRRCASGVYFVRFATDQYKASKKMVLIK